MFRNFQSLHTSSIMKKTEYTRSMVEEKEAGTFCHVRKWSKLI